MQRGSEKGMGDKGKGGQGDQKSPSPHLLASLSPCLLVSLFAFLAFFSPLFAQQSRKAEVIRPGQEFELSINQEAVVEGESLAVAFEAVLEDSRCPEGVDCIWSGN